MKLRGCVLIIMLSTEDLKKLYIKSAQNLYVREMLIRERTEIHRLAVILDMSELEVEAIWNEDLAP